MISVVVLDNTNIVVAIIINDFNSYCGMLLDIGLNGKFAVGLIVVERLIKMNKWLVMYCGREEWRISYTYKAKHKSNNWNLKRTLVGC